MPTDDILGGGEDPLAGERGVTGDMDAFRLLDGMSCSGLRRGCDPVQLRQCLRRKRQVGRGQVLAEVRAR